MTENMVFVCSGADYDTKLGGQEGASVRMLMEEIYCKVGSVSVLAERVKSAFF